MASAADTEPRSGAGLAPLPLARPLPAAAPLRAARLTLSAPESFRGWGGRDEGTGRGGEGRGRPGLHHRPASSVPPSFPLARATRRVPVGCGGAAPWVRV